MQNNVTVVGNKFLDKAYIDYLKTCNIIEGPKLKELIKKFHKTRDKKILNLIVNSFQRLIVKIVTKIHRTANGSCFDLMDLVQVGNMAVMKGLTLYLEDKTKGYNPNKNILPSTYFTNTITNYVNNYVTRHYSIIHTPDASLSKLERIRNYNRYKEQHQIKDDKEAIKLFNLDTKKSLKRNKRVVSFVPITLSDIKEYQDYSYKSIYSELTHDGDNCTLLDILPNDNSQSPEDITRENELFNRVKSVLSNKEYEIFIAFAEDLYTERELCKKYSLKQRDLTELIENCRNKLQKYLS